MTDLGPHGPQWPLHAGDGAEGSLSNRSAKLGRGQEHRWWLDHWTTFDKAGRSADENTLPRQRDDTAVLPEANLLRPLMFGTDAFGRRRRDVALRLGESAATKHIELCEHLARVCGDDSIIGLLPLFSCLADAGMAAMDLIPNSLRENSSVPLAEVAKLPAATPICRDLLLAAQEWSKQATMQIRHIEAAHRFASAILSPRPVECLKAVLQHHEACCGGLRWFVLRNGRVEPRTPARTGFSRYRFRLWPLCRLAAQCGVLRRVPVALEHDAEGQDAESVDA